jgi:hypothetical protein
MKFRPILAAFALFYVLGFGTFATLRFLKQRDEIVRIEKTNTALKVIELQGNVHCEPS